MLQKLLQDNEGLWTPYTCFESASHGHWHLLQWLRSQTPPCPWHVDECLRVAIHYGHWHVVQGILHVPTVAHQPQILFSFHGFTNISPEPQFYSARRWLSQTTNMIWPDAVSSWLDAVDAALAQLLIPDLTALLKTFL